MSRAASAARIPFGHARTSPTTRSSHNSAIVTAIAIAYFTT